MVCSVDMEKSLNKEEEQGGEEEEEEEEEKKELGTFEVSSQSLPAKPNLKGDWLNFFLLILLYTIQGLPLGLVIAFPIIFQSKKIVTYKEQVNFSLRILYLM
jgi:MFS transporter, PAT family, solute carrier family 33 (acetyl-CoA transportor), member 1